MSSYTIVAVYDTPAHAELAIADLEQAGIPTSSIQHYTQDTAPGLDTTTSGTPYATASNAHAETHEHTGFWAWLTGSETTTEHHALYDQSIAHGGTVVTVIADERDGDRISSILEQHAPIDMEERASQYAAGSTVNTGTAHAAPPVAATAGEQVLSLSEEVLEVGKREVQAGITRLRRYVVERPVEEQVRLRDETVKVFRRPVTGATVGADAFTDRTIEMTHTSEEAVIGKTAHVVEEVVLQKGVQERTETVRDTLRKEEVEITGPNDGHTASTLRETSPV